MTPMRTRDINRTSQVLSPDEIDRVDAITTKLRQSVRNGDNYKLLSLILMTNCPQLSGIHNWYLKQYLNNDNLEGSDQFDNRSEQLKFVMEMIREMGKIMAK